MIETFLDEINRLNAEIKEHEKSIEEFKTAISLHEGWIQVKQKRIAELHE